MTLVLIKSESDVRDMIKEIFDGRICVLAGHNRRDMLRK